MCRLVGEKAHGAKVAIAVLACSKGAEVYSILWSIRTSASGLESHPAGSRYFSGDY